MGLESVMAVATAGMQISQGFQQKRAYKQQAELYEQQAAGIGVSQRLEASKYNRLKGQYAGKIVSRVAKSGLELSGSPALVLADTISQIELDKQIGQYNLELEKRYALASAEQSRYRGKTALISSFGSAFSTMLKYGNFGSLGQSSGGQALYGKSTPAPTTFGGFSTQGSFPSNWR